MNDHVKRLVDTMQGAAGEMRPQEFKAWLAGTLASVFGNLPEDYWHDFIKVEPCGHVGCDCHLGIALHGSELFKLLRADYLQYGPERREERE